MSEATRFGYVLRGVFPIFSPKSAIASLSQSISSWLEMGPWDAILLQAGSSVNSTHLFCLSLSSGEDAQMVEVAKASGAGGQVEHARLRAVATKTNGGILSPLGQPDPRYTL